MLIFQGQQHWGLGGLVRAAASALVPCLPWQASFIRALVLFIRTSDLTISQRVEEHRYSVCCRVIPLNCDSGILVW